MRVIFFAVDCQRDFMLKDGKLYVQDAEKIIPTLSKLTQFAKDNNIRVVSTADFHTCASKEISSNPDFINTFPEHCMAWTEGVDFIKETIPKGLAGYYIVGCSQESLMPHLDIARNVIIHKDAFDVFTGNKLTEEVLKRINPDVVVVYGVASDVCVNFAVLGLAKRGYKVIVVSDAIQNLPTANMVRIVHEWMKYDNVEVKTFDDVIKKLKG